MDVGLRGYKGRHSLAAICLEQKRYSEAETHWLSAIREEPAFLPAQLGLGKLYTQTKSWDALEAHANSLMRLGSQGEEARAFLLGLGQMHKGDRSTALRCLNSSAERFPNSLRIKRLLAQVTVQEGTDMNAAEKVLREILELDPKDDKARLAIESIQKKRRLEASAVNL